MELMRPRSFIGTPASLLLHSKQGFDESYISHFISSYFLSQSPTVTSTLAGPRAVGTRGTPSHRKHGGRRSLALIPDLPLAERKFRRRLQDPELFLHHNRAASLALGRVPEETGV